MRQSHDYGKLSGRIVEDLLETTRILEGQDEKRNKADFALWKSAPPQAYHALEKPVGRGFPGLAYRMFRNGNKIFRRQGSIFMAVAWICCFHIMKVKLHKVRSAIMQPGKILDA